MCVCVCVPTSALPLLFLDKWFVQIYLNVVMWSQSLQANPPIDGLKVEYLSFVRFLSHLEWMCLTWSLILIKHLSLSDMWLARLQEQILERHVFKKDWTTCSKYDNHSRLNNQHNWERRGGGWGFNTTI